MVLYFFLQKKKIHFHFFVKIYKLDFGQTYFLIHFPMLLPHMQIVMLDIQL